MTEAKQGWTGGEDFDWDEVPDGAPETPPEGLYTGKIIEAKAEETSNDNPAIKLTVELQAPFGGGELGYVSRKVRDTMVLTKDAAFRFKQLAVAAGTKPPRGSQFEAMNDFAEDLVGREVIIKTKNVPARDKSRVYANVSLYCTAEQADQEAKGVVTSVGSAVKRPPARPRKAATA